MTFAAAPGMRLKEFVLARALASNQSITALSLLPARQVERLAIINNHKRP